jgi:hypothetical protein
MAAFNDALWEDAMAIQPLRRIPKRVGHERETARGTPEGPHPTPQDRNLRAHNRRRDHPANRGRGAYAGCRTIYRTLSAEDEEEFRQQYARAKEFQLYRMEDELLEIADDATNDWIEPNDPDNPGWRVNGKPIQRSRVRIDTRKWIMSKRAPKKCGDRIHQEIEAQSEAVAFPVVRVFSPRPEEDGGQEIPPSAVRRLG